MIRRTLRKLNLGGWALALALSPAVLAAQPLEPAQPAPPAVPAPPEARAKQMYFLGGGGTFLGVGVSEVDSERARALKLKDEYGVEVTRVEEDSPASKAGLKSGDVVLEFNGQRVEGTEQFVRFVRETPAGRTVKLLVNRGGVNQTIAATLAARKTPKWASDLDKMQIELPDMGALMPPDIPRPMMSWNSSMLGVEAMPVEGQLAAYFGVKEGVLVRSVLKGTAAEKAGIKAGDVIIKVDESRVTAPREITNAIRASKTKKALPISLMRDRKETTLTVTLEQEDAERPAARPRANTVRQRLF